MIIVLLLSLRYMLNTILWIPLLYSTSEVKAASCTTVIHYHWKPLCINVNVGYWLGKIMYLCHSEICSFIKEIYMKKNTCILKSNKISACKTAIASSKVAVTYLFKTFLFVSYLSFLLYICFWDTPVLLKDYTWQGMGIYGRWWGWKLGQPQARQAL